MQKAFCLALARSYGLAWLQLPDLKNSRLPFRAWHFIYFYKKSAEEQSSTTKGAAAASLAGEFPGAARGIAGAVWRPCPSSTWSSWHQEPISSWLCPALEIPVLWNGAAKGLHPWKKRVGVFAEDGCIVSVSLCSLTNSHQGKGHCLKSCLGSSEQLPLLLGRTHKFQTWVFLYVFRIQM